MENAMAAKAESRTWYGHHIMIAGGWRNATRRRAQGSEPALHFPRGQHGLFFWIALTKPASGPCARAPRIVSSTTCASRSSLRLMGRYACTWPSRQLQLRLLMLTDASAPNATSCRPAIATPTGREYHSDDGDIHHRIRTSLAYQNNCLHTAHFGCVSPEPTRT